MLIVTFVLYSAVSYTAPDKEYVVKTLQCNMSIMFFLKLHYYLCCIDKLGFLLHMISNVFYDIKNFLIYFLLYNIFGAIYLSICLTSINSEYNGYGVLSYVLMSFRVSIGDPDFISFA